MRGRRSLLLLVSLMILGFLLADLVGSRHRLGVPECRAFQGERDGRRGRPPLRAYPHHNVFVIQLNSYRKYLEPTYLQNARSAWSASSTVNISERRNGTYRHHNINEREVGVSQPSHDLDRLFQKLATFSPIDHWKSLIVRSGIGIVLANCQRLRKCPQEDSHSGLGYDCGATKDKVTFVITFVRGYYGRETLDRAAV